MKKAIFIPAVLLFLVLAYGAGVPSGFFTNGIFTYWVKTDTTLTVNNDTASASMRQYIIRLADSAAANRAGSDYIVYRMYGLLGQTAAQDSVNLQVGVNGVYEAIRPNFNVFAYNFALLTTTGQERLSTFDGGKPVFNTADSLLIVRLSRDTARATDKECAITIYKLPKTAGADINTKTVGDFYDMYSFPLSVLPLGANRFFTVDVAFRRQP